MTVVSFLCDVCCLFGVQYRYCVVRQHCRFPPSLTPRVIAFHADRAEPDINALVWVRKTASLKRHKEVGPYLSFFFFMVSVASVQDSYLKVVRGHIYHLHFTFAHGSLVNQYIAQGMFILHSPFFMFVYIHISSVCYRLGLYGVPVHVQTQAWSNRCVPIACRNANSCKLAGYGFSLYFCS